MVTIKVVERDCQAGTNFRDVYMKSDPPHPADGCVGLIRKEEKGWRVHSQQTDVPFFEEADGAAVWLAGQFVQFGGYSRMPCLGNAL